VAPSRIHNQPCMTHSRPQPLTHSLIHIDDSINTTVHKNSTFRFISSIVSIFYFFIFLFFVFVIYLVSLVFFLALFIRLLACFYSLSLGFFLILFSVLTNFYVPRTLLHFSFALHPYTFSLFNFRLYLT